MSVVEAGSDAAPAPVWKPECVSCPSQLAAGWSALDPEGLALLKESKRLCVYEPGEVVFYQGNPGAGIHCIESGVVAIRKSHDHDEGPILRLCEPGNVLGLRDVFANRPYSTTAQAVTRCRLCLIDGTVLRKLLAGNPDLGLCHLQALSRELDETEASLLAWRPMSVRARLASVLLTLKDRFATADESGRITLKLPLSRTDVAWMVGARPESVSRAIRALEGDGVAEFNRRSVVIPDLDALLDEVEGGQGADFVI